jgi:hypothetical protein
VRGDIPVNSDVFLMIDFVNIKIKPIQSFRNTHKGEMYVYVFIKISDYSICVCTVFLKNNSLAAGKHRYQN